MYEGGDLRITVKVLNTEAEKSRLIQQIDKEKKQRASKSKTSSRAKSALEKVEEENKSLRSALIAMQVCITFI